jgi:hypothetical protein
MSAIKIENFTGKVGPGSATQHDCYARYVLGSTVTVRRKALKFRFESF